MNKGHSSVEHAREAHKKGKFIIPIFIPVLLVTLFVPSFASAGAPFVGAFVVCDEIMQSSDIEENVHNDPYEFVKTWREEKDVVHGGSKMVHDFKDDPERLLPLVDGKGYEVMDFHGYPSGLGIGGIGPITDDQQKIIEKLCEKPFPRDTINMELEKWVKEMKRARPYYFASVTDFIVFPNEESFLSVSDDYIAEWKHARQDTKNEGMKKSCAVPYSKTIGEWVVTHQSKQKTFCIARTRLREFGSLVSSVVFKR